jgi:hypothetical protein
MIECVEFRRLLLLLREDLRDQDIPHRTKLREEVIKAWQNYFAILKEDMGVCTTVHTSTAQLTSHFGLACGRRHLTHRRYLVK